MNIYINNLNLKFSIEEKQILADCANYFGNGGVWIERSTAEMLGVPYAIKCLKKLMASSKKLSVKDKYKTVASNHAKIAKGLIKKITCNVQ